MKTVIGIKITGCKKRKTWSTEINMVGIPPMVLIKTAQFLSGTIEYPIRPALSGPLLILMVRIQLLDKDIFFIEMDFSKPITS